MKEIEQLRADLATLRAAREIAAHLDGGFSSMRFRTLINDLQDKIATLEAQQAPVDVWAEIKEYWEGVSDSDTVKRYIRHLESKVAVLENELRCERIDGGKVRDDRKAISAERLREKLAELTTILNAIPPACGEAMELVKRRIESVKKELQDNG